MTPRSAMQNIPNTSLSNPKHGPKLGLRDSTSRIKFPDLPDFILRKCGVGVFFSTLSEHPILRPLWHKPLSHSVMRIVLGCTKEKMRRVATRFIVALVAYKQTSGNATSAGQFPRNSMGKQLFLLPANNPVPVVPNPSSPPPTIIWTGDPHFGPKTVSERILKPLVSFGSCHPK